MSTSGVAVSAGRRTTGPLGRGIHWLLVHGEWKLRHYGRGLDFVQKELASTVRVPARVKPGLWRRGFLSESWVLYDLARNDRRQYLPDYARFTRTPLINGSYAPVLDNKLIFDRFVGASPAASCGALPRLVGIVRAGRLIDPSGRLPERASGQGVLDELTAAGALVLKPLAGGGGRGLSMLRRSQRGPITLNGAEIDETALRRHVEAGDDLMACAFVDQHPAFARLHPPTTNTLRILTIQDGFCEPFIAAAVLRIGTARSGPADNWSRGGLSAGIDIGTGRVGRAVAYPAGGDRLVWYLSHPDSGAAIEGMTIPHWERVRDGLLGIFRSLPVLHYVGWDVIVTADGFRILEGNNYSDVNLLQVHAPLLADDRVRDFYRRHGVL